MNYAIVPVRDYSNTKIRLGHILTEEKRAKLTTSLLRRVLLAIENSSIDLVVVVATNPLEVMQSAEGLLKVRIIREPKERGGVNLAMMCGLGYIRKVGNVPFNVLMMPSDLPFLDTDTINLVLKQKRYHEIVINGSRKKDGTSLLLMEDSKIIPLHYDDNSFVKHQDEASRLKLKSLIVDLKQFSFDVDDDEDYNLLMKDLSANSFDDLISKIQSMK